MKATGANGQRGRDRPPPKLEEFGSRTRNGFVIRRESFSQLLPKQFTLFTVGPKKKY